MDEPILNDRQNSTRSMLRADFLRANDELGVFFTAGAVSAFYACLSRLDASIGHSDGAMIEGVYAAAIGAFSIRHACRAISALRNKPASPAL